MIEPIAESNRLAREYVVCDIENRRNGRVIAIDTFDGSVHTDHYDWGSWVGWIRQLAKRERAYRTIYAHNGGGWDWLSLLEHLARWSDDPFNVIQNGGTVIGVTLSDPDAKGPAIRLMDSYRLLDCSLDAAGKKYVGRGKVETPHLPEWLWKNDRRKFWQYLHNDTELLWESLRVFGDTLFTKVARIGRLGITLPSTSMRVFRTGFLREPISVPLDDSVRTLLRAAYAGGRVEAFKPGYYKRIHVYDFNSLYPSVMANTPVPTSGNVQWTNDLILDRCGCYRVKFWQGDRSKPPVLMVNGKGEYVGEGVYFTNELRRLFYKAEGAIVVLEGFTFTDEAVVFRDFVRTLYRLRMTDKDGALGDVCKKMMNSLYGKWAQKSERSRTMRIDYDAMVDLRDAGAKIDILSEEWGIYRVTEERQAPYEHVGIAGTITAEARARLWEAFDAGTVYCDTDSIHTTIERKSNATRLGALKHEYSGEGVYCGKKLYGLRNVNHPDPKKREKVRAKGVRVGGKLGCRLDFDTLASLLSGRSVLCNFRSATTANAMFRGAPACVMRKRKRRIRVTANGTEGNSCRVIGRRSDQRGSDPKRIDRKRGGKHRDSRQ